MFYVDSRDAKLGEEMMNRQQLTFVGSFTVMKCIEMMNALVLHW